MTAKGLPNITREGPDGTETFGPIFQKDFMYALMDLQEHIINEVTGEDGEKLGDVCFKVVTNKRFQIVFPLFQKSSFQTYLEY